MKRILSIGLIFTLTGLQPTLSWATISMSISIHKISDNSVDTEVQWPAMSLPAGWVVASHYIQIDSSLSDAADGIQIYTDNTAVDANPAYAGTIGPTRPVPAGLIHTTNRLLRIPTAWRISDALITPSPVSPIANMGESFQWFYHQDRAQVANNLGASNFTPGDSYMTVENAICPGGLIMPCIHYGQSPFEFGAAASPNYVYLEADFSNAMANSTYKTSTLRIEAFSQ